MHLLKQVVVLALASVLASPAWAEVTPSVSYSADYVMETADMAQTGRIYVAPGKERREMKMEGMTMINIRRDDLGKLWMLMPDEQMYMEMRMGTKNPNQTMSENPGDYAIEMTEVGPETLNGVETIKQKVIMTSQDGSKMGGFWWTTAEGICVKMDMLAVEEGDKMRLKQELRNIVMGPPDPSLFEIPPGYMNMSMGLGQSAPALLSSDS